MHALTLVLLLQIYDEPYTALLDANHPRSELKSLRSDVERHRSALIDACKKEEDRLKTQLESTRQQLKGLNTQASQDTRTMAETREGLHHLVEATEEPLRESRKECEPRITAASEIKLGKLRVAEEWPDRRKEILEAIDEGRARRRNFGDIEDIGYRKFFEGQETDIATGEQAVRRMKFSGMMPPELQDSAVQDYVRRLAETIAQHSDLKVPLHVSVVESPEISAIALPGGFLFISSGLIAVSGAESELAGILAHEIGRIAARHGTRASKRSRVSSIFVQGLHVASSFLTGGFGSVAAMNGVNLGFQGLDALVDRTLMDAQGKYEKEAGQLGVQYAWKAGFDPRGFVMLLDSISRQEASQTAGFFRTHPHLDERTLNVFSEIQYLPESKAGVRDSVEFHQMKERIPMLR